MTIEQLLSNMLSDRLVEVKGANSGENYFLHITRVEASPSNVTIFYDNNADRTTKRIDLDEIAHLTVLDEAEEDDE